MTGIRRKNDPGNLRKVPASKKKREPNKRLSVRLAMLKASSLSSSSSYPSGSSPPYSGIGYGNLTIDPVPSYVDTTIASASSHVDTTIAPMSSYVGSGTPALAPTATYVGSGTPVLAPAATYLSSGTPVLAPTATYVGQSSPAEYETQDFTVTSSNSVLELGSLPSPVSGQIALEPESETRLDLEPLLDLEEEVRLRPPAPLVLPMEADSAMGHVWRCFCRDLADYLENYDVIQYANYPPADLFRTKHFSLKK